VNDRVILEMRSATAHPASSLHLTRSHHRPQDLEAAHTDDEWATDILRTELQSSNVHGLTPAVITGKRSRWEK